MRQGQVRDQGQEQGAGPEAGTGDFRLCGARSET
jgi:hypothetical protein